MRLDPPKCMHRTAANTAKLLAQACDLPAISRRLPVRMHLTNAAELLAQLIHRAARTPTPTLTPNPTPTPTPNPNTNTNTNTNTNPAQLIHRAAVPITVLKVVRWHGLSARTVFFWQVFFVELLGAPSAAQRAAMLTLREPASSELRDGVLVFLERHVRTTIAKQQPELRRALQAMIDSLDVA